jgi:hypothetical protein|tara:strand:+ start:1262 stop:1528 length:267 start_codon:yes stop_codon:yes gene_type:complete
LIGLYLIKDFIFLVDDGGLPACSFQLRVLPHDKRYALMCKSWMTRFLNTSSGTTKTKPSIAGKNYLNLLSYIFALIFNIRPSAHDKLL